MSETTTAIERKPITITATVPATERYKRFLQVTSLFLKEPLTPTEIDIVDEFYHADAGNITTESRKTVRENLNISAGNLNNYIGVLRDKKIIIGDSLHRLFLQNIADSEEMSFVINLTVVV